MRRNTTYLLTLLGYLLLQIAILQTTAQIGDWTSKASLPQPTSQVGAAVVDGKIFAIGGWIGGSALWSDTNFKYDPSSDSWVQKANMPTKRTLLAVASVGSKVYAIGGVTSFSGGTYSTNEEYDTLADTWTSKTNMPTPRCYITGAVVAGKIYIISGSNNAGGLFSVNEVYDPATDTWSTRAEIPTPRHSYGIGVVNGRIYVIGGWSGSTSTAVNEEYDPATDTWSPKAPMPTARNGLSVAVMNNRIYAIGGATNANPWTNTLNTVEEYNPSNNTWRSVSNMPTHRVHSSSVAVANSIYVIGGSNDTSLLTTNEKLSSFEPPAITLTPPSGLAATTVNGSGFAGTSEITITWGDTPLPTLPRSIITDPNGRFTAIICVPNQTTPNVYTIKAADEFDNWVTAEFNVNDIQRTSMNTQELMIMIALPTVVSVIAIGLATTALLKRKP